MTNQTISSRRSLLIVCIILFLTFLDNTIVSVVLSNIQTKLSAGVEDLQWVVNSYMLVFAVFMLFGGTLGDIIGRKKIMIFGVGIFVAGSAIATLANSTGVLIIGRIIMGLGAAASEPGTLSMLRHIYPEHKKRSRALGVWAAVSGIALAFGPIIGGVITGFSDWRGVFAFSVFFGILALVLGLVFLPENADPKGRSFDVLGLMAGGISLSSIIIALISGESYGYRVWWIIILFIMAAASMVAFLFIERRARDPVLPLTFFKDIHFSLANAVAFTVNFSIFAVFFFVALYLQLIANFSGYRIALGFLAMTVAIVASSLIAGRWNARHKTIPLTIAGCFIAAVGVFMLNQIINPNVGIINLSWTLAMCGFGFGICLVAMTASVLNAVEPERSGMAASTINTFRELGGVFGVAILGSIVNAQLTTQLAGQLRSLGLPSNFQSFVIYAITHGGNTPHGVNVTTSELISHASLIGKVTQAAYQAFGNGLTIALYIATAMLSLIGIVAAGIYVRQRNTYKQTAIS